MEGQQRGEAAARACEEPCAASRGAEAAHCCTQADGGEAVVTKRPVVEDPGKAADSARTEKAGAGLGWDGGKVAWRNGRLVACPSCRAAEEEGR